MHGIEVKFSITKQRQTKHQYFFCPDCGCFERFVMFSRWTWRSLWTILNSFKQNTAKSCEGRFQSCLQKPQNSLNNRHWFKREKEKKRNCLCRISKHLSFVITPPCLTIFRSSLIFPMIRKFKLGSFCHPSLVLTCSLTPSCLQSTLTLQIPFQKGLTPDSCLYLPHLLSPPPGSDVFRPLFFLQLNSRPRHFGV